MTELEHVPPVGSVGNLFTRSTWAAAAGGEAAITDPRVLHGKGYAYQ